MFCSGRKDCIKEEIICGLSERRSSDRGCAECDGGTSALHSEDSCEIQGSCITKYVWKKVNGSMAQTVDSIMINTLVETNKEIKKEGQKDE